MKRKGIILAIGHGSRFYLVSILVSEQLERLATSLDKNGYGQHSLQVLEEIEKQ